MKEMLHLTSEGDVVVLQDEMPQLRGLCELGEEGFSGPQPRPLLDTVSTDRIAGVSRTLLYSTLL